MGDVIVAVSDREVSCNRKILLGYIDDYQDYKVIRPTDLIYSRFGDRVVLQYPSAVKLLLVSRVIRAALRRHGAQRDFFDNDLRIEMVTGNAVVRHRGETPPAAKKRAANLRELQPDIERDRERIDDLFWDAMFDVPGRHFNADDPEIQKFVGCLYDDLVVVEQGLHAQGPHGNALIARLEALRKEGFLSFKVFGNRTEGRLMFKKLIRSAVHMTSKMSGLAALSLVAERISPEPNDAEIKMLSLLYGPCRELGGVSLDLLGRRANALKPYISDLYEAYATGADNRRVQETRDRLLDFYSRTAVYVSLLRESWREAQRHNRAMKSQSVARPSTKPRLLRAGAETLRPHHVPASAAHKAVARQMMLILEDEGAWEKFCAPLQSRTRRRLESLRKHMGNLGDAAEELGCTTKQLRDTMRKTVVQRLPRFVKEYREEQGHG